MQAKAKLKVLFLVPSLYRAGAETQLVDLVNGLSNQEFEKHLFTFEHNLDQRDRLDTQHVTLYNKPRSYKLDLVPVKHIGQLIDSRQIDIIHCTQQFSLLLAWLGRLQAHRNPPIVTAIHSTYTYSLKNKLQKMLLYRHLLRFCTSDIIFVCHNQRRHWLSKYPSLSDHSEVIYNGIDVQHFAPEPWISAGHALRQKLKIPVDSQVISCIASFRAIKGHHFLIDAFASLSDQKTYLILAGDGQMRASIEQQIQHYNLKERIKLLGNIDDVRPLLAMSDLTVLPSTAETFSMSMLESMSMEVPVLATDVGGSGEAVIPYKTGFLIKAGSTTALTKELTNALRAPDNLVNMGKSGRYLVLEQFTRETMINNTAVVLQSKA